MNRFAIIIPYFGKFKPSISLFLESCNRNPDVDWHIFTDCPVPENVELKENIKWHAATLDYVSGLIREKLGWTVSLTRPYKLCDLKPFYGLLFEEYLTGYEYWGFGDTDVIYGHLTKYLGHIRILTPGHKPVFRKAGPQLPPVGQAPQFPVHRRHKGGYIAALFPEKLGYVIFAEAAVLQHGLSGIVHGVESIHIFRVPAAVLEAALNADLIRRPVKYAGNVFIVVGFGHILAHGFKKLPVGLAQILHPPCGKTAQVRFPAAPLHALKYHPHRIEK
jgi:hypothetical protein